MAVTENFVVLTTIFIVLTCNQQTFNHNRSENCIKRYLDISEFIVDCSITKYQGLIYANDVSYLWQISPMEFVPGNRANVTCKNYMTVNAKSILLLCMMQSGDIHPHPGLDVQNQGPTQKKKCTQPKFPCVSCSRGVTASCKAVSCNLCQNWTHIRCTGFITDARYDKLVQEELELDFICNGCTNKEFPFSEEFDFYHSDKQTFSATKLPSSADPDHFQCFSRKGLHFLHINARSLLPKMNYG